VNWLAGLVAEAPAGVATVTSTVPAPGGLVAVIWVSESTFTIGALAAPNPTSVAPVNPLPVMVTISPPAALPLMTISSWMQRSLRLLSEPTPVLC
jgi:hypothetical protein